MSNEQLMALADEMAAPQEGEWPDYVMLRDTKLCDDMGGLGQRIFTTAGAGYTKVKYVRADLAANPSACELGQRISDYLCGLAENGMVTLDPFDSNNIDAIVQAALQQRGDSRGGEG